MVSAVREICIFMVIAQAVMFFVPSDSYMKYVRILVGILMILKFTEPILIFLADEEAGQKISDRMQALWEGMDQEGQELSIEDGSIGIYRGIEEELQTRLNQCQGGFEVKGVELVDEEGQIVVTVALQSALKEDSLEREIHIDPVVLGEAGSENSSYQMEEDEKEELEGLKELYGGCIGISPEKIKIRYAQ